MLLINEFVGPARDFCASQCYTLFVERAQSACVGGYRISSSHPHSFVAANDQRSRYLKKMENNILQIDNRKAFRRWLALHADNENECWVELKRGRPAADVRFYYLDAVEEALCFGWIDSTYKLINGKRMQRFTPRKKNSPWTELNKERVRRLEKLGLMTEAGRAVLPAMGVRSFIIDPDIEAALIKARVWSRFKSFPSLYRRVRAGNIAFYKKRNPAMYEKALFHLITETKKGKMYGEWNDYGRLLEY